MPLLLNNQEVAAALSAGDYVEAMEEAFRELLSGLVSRIEELVNETSDQQLATEAPEDGKFSAYVEACHVKNVEVFEFVWENRALMAMVHDDANVEQALQLIESR